MSEPKLREDRWVTQATEMTWESYEFSVTPIIQDSKCKGWKQQQITLPQLERLEI